MTKIGSHHGVRSDLFKRPLDKTRITDFFGGVAQVEVVSPDDAMSSTLQSEAFSPEEVQKHERVLPPPSTAAATSGLFTIREWRVMRTWTSIGLIGVLVCWVVSKR